MNTAIVSRAPNRTKPHHISPSRVVALPSLTESVDHLAELRGLIRQAQDEERRITAEILGFMESAGLGRLEGASTVAIRDERTALRVDVGLFVETLGTKSYGALTVSVTAARKLLGEADLCAISETVTAPVLRVVALDAKGGAA